MTAQDPPAQGIELGVRAVLALANEREGEAIALLETAPDGLTPWTAAYLLQMVREVAIVATGGDREQALEVLRDAANHELATGEDALAATVATIMNDAERRLL